MPSLWSVAAAAAITLAGWASLEASVSVIALSLLPLAPLQAEPGHQDRGQQERDHGGGDRRPLPELAAENRALIGQRRHELRRVHRPAAREHPDELEVGEGEQHR